MITALAKGAKAGAVVLAAGKGTRMGALSDQLPKPLVPVAGHPLLDRVLDHLQAAGVADTVVNIHHLADLLQAHLKARLAGPNIVISDERDQLLETGGGVRKALDLLQEDFLVINSDALWTDSAGGDPALVRLQAAFDPGRMDACLLLVPVADALGYDGAGDFFMDAAGQLTARGEAASAPYVYGGVQFIQREALRPYPVMRWSLASFFRDSVASGRLYGMVHSGDWMHVGTPRGVQQAEARLMQPGDAG